MRRYISEEMSGWEMEREGGGSVEEDAAQRIKEKNVLTGRPSRSVTVIRGGDNKGDESSRGSDVGRFNDADRLNVTVRLLF